MTDRVKGFTVTLERDIRDDDFKRIGKAVEMIKGVLHVEPSITTGDDFMVRQQVKHEMTMKIYKALKED